MVTEKMLDVSCFHWSKKSNLHT